MPTNQTMFNEILTRMRANDLALTLVDLDSSGITDADCTLLADAIKNNTWVITLNLRNNSIGPTGANTIVNALQMNNVLQNLWFYGNFIGDAGVSALINSLEENQVVSGLELGSNLITYDGVILLAEALQANRILLKALTLNDNTIGNIGAIALASMLRINKDLIYLELGDTNIDDTGARALASALQVNTVLQALKFSSNPISATGAQAFANALQYNYALTIFTLDVNNSQVNTYLSRNQQCAGQLQPVLGCPVFATNSLTIHRGETKPLTPDNLFLTDVSRKTPLNGNFTVSNVFRGQFLTAENQSIITRFSQFDINNNQILFRHDNGTNPPSYMVTAQFGNLTTWAESAVITFLPFFLPTSSTTTLSPQRVAFYTALTQIQNNLVTSITLTDSGINDTDCVLLANALRNNTSLVILNLGNNVIGDTGVTFLVSALQENRVLQELYLYGNTISNTGAATIASILETNTVLQRLFLNENSISTMGAIALANMLRTNTILQRFHVGRNLLGNSGANAFASALQVNKVLYEFDCFHSSIGDAGAEAFAEMLKNNTVLTYLDLSVNSISDKGARLLADALRVNTVLQLLSITENLLSFLGVQYLAQSLQVNRSLKNLNIALNAVGDPGALILLNALQNNFILTALGIDINSYTAQINTLLLRNQQCAAQTIFCPVLVANQFFIENSQLIVLTTDQLRVATPTGTLLDAVFDITEIFHGQFFRNQQPVFSFTQSQIINSEISFQPDGSGMPPSFNVTARYSNLTTFPQPAKINFNNPPVLMHSLMDQTVSVNESFSIHIPSNTFSDPDNQSLTFEVECDDQNLPLWLNFTDQTFRGRAPSVSSHRLSIFARDPLNATASTVFNLAVVAPKETATVDSSTSSALLSAGVLIAIIAGVSALVILFIVGIFLYRRSHTNKIQMDPALEGPNTLALQDNPVYGQGNNKRTVAGAQVEETNDNEDHWDGRTYETGGSQDHPWDQSTYATGGLSHSTVDMIPKPSDNFSIPWDADVYSIEEGQANENRNQMVLRT